MLFASGQARRRGNEKVGGSKTHVSVIKKPKVFLTPWAFFVLLDKKGGGKFLLPKKGCYPYFKGAKAPLKQYLFVRLLRERVAPFYFQYAVWRAKRTSWLQWH